MNKFALILPLLVLGCSMSPSEACDAFADELSDAFTRCGADGLGVKASFVVALGGCSNVVAVRDEDALVDECFPFVREASCTFLLGPSFALPESCQMQLFTK